MYRIILFSILVSVFRLEAQEKTIFPWEFRLNTHTGVLLPEYGFISYSVNDFTRGFEFSALYQTSGKNKWEKLYRYPGWGASVFFSTMGNAEVFGNQVSFYPYYRLHLLNRDKWGLYYQMGVGATWATRKFHLTENFSNLAIATHLNIHYHADVLLKVNLSPRLTMNGGISFNHISNANLSEPNVGLNFANLTAGITYNFGRPVPLHSFDSLPAFQPITQYLVLVAGGLKHTRTFESFKYPAFAVSFDVRRRAFYKFAFGIGIDFFYDSSTEPQMIRQNREFKPQYAYTSGIHLSQEFIYDRFSLILHEGVYLGLTNQLNGYTFYNRAIARWHFTNHLFANISMKSHLYILDFPEIGVGYYW